MATPDVTKAQIIALVQAVLAVIVAFGVHLSSAQQTGLVTLSGVLATILIAADVAIRRGRQKHLAGAVRLADVADAIARARAPKVKPAEQDGLTVAALQAERAKTETIADQIAEQANGPQPPPGTYPADGPAGPQNPA